VTASRSVLSLLVVEDEPSIRFAIREYFEAEGWQVTCVSTAHEAEQALKDEPVDVAVLDLRLGVDDVDGGLVLAAWITRASPLTRTILLTGYGSEATLKKAHEIGVAEVLDKPTRLRELSRLATRLAAGEPEASVIRPA
jgi:DNA-binding response OmpR family regulator